jgi:ribulose-5-phosphate 4-epimerase/fuculose-1-phosphate aldolase
MSQWHEAKKTVLEAARNMLEKGLVVGTAGNISLRLPPEGERQLLAITPSYWPLPPAPGTTTYWTLMTSRY